MLNSYKDFINYTLLLEKRGTWNYFDFSDIADNEESNDELRSGFSKIYDFIRTEIIRRLNEVDLSGQIDKFQVPLKLLKVSHDILLNPIIVEYRPKIVSRDGIKMMVDKKDNGVIELSIMTDIRNTSFKVLVMHELRHCLQKSVADYVHHDYYRLIYIRNPRLINNPDIKKIIDAVYRLNPQESTAYMEQTYNTAFVSKFEDNSQTFDDIYQICLNEYKVGDVRWDDIHNIVMSEDPEVKDYVLTMFVMNISELTSEMHGYRLFTDKLYNNKIVVDFREKIRHLQTDEEDRLSKGLVPVKYEVADDIESVAAELSKNPIFYRQVRNIFWKRLDYYRNKYIEDVVPVIKFAIENAEFENNNEYALTNSQHQQMYTRIENKITYIEVLFEDLRSHQKRILEISDRFPYDVFRKYNMLKRYMRGKCKVQFVYQGVFDKVAAMYDYVKDVIPGDIVYKNVDDLQRVVNYVNSLKLK